MQAPYRYFFRSLLAGIDPEIGAVLPMERAEEAFRAMREGRTRGKTVVTR
jgi:hypothetical protein